MLFQFNISSGFLSIKGFLLAFILLSLIPGGIFVSILNDITDIKMDTLAGKSNGMKNFSKTQRGIFLILPLLATFIFLWFMKAAPIAMISYFLCILSFTLYSVKPFRLKERGIWGIFADALGSQVFTTLYATFLILENSNVNIPTVEIILITLWSACFGIRGILWHQFHDLENDIKSGIPTIAQSFSSRKTAITGFLIMATEIIALAGIILISGQYWCFVALLLYFSYIVDRRIRFYTEIIPFKYTRKDYCIFMNECYQIFLPVILLILLSFFEPLYGILLLAHLFLFPIGIIQVGKMVFLR
ncbi:UbiA family prenyltransferase [Salegentibacter sp. F188]|uniref:UbiA family prenyltransferase n=1 Tax=Autumnicola patrickiae TaxID=3075591 RepID=A0ABU3E305_9FLAO|nr:UbiA family prenyltransferase [Salegentibacter sp. F188]MDT0690317.1 UbiA family prenyltransferase [Salegentibacter sp. F188]